MESATTLTFQTKNLFKLHVAANPNTKEVVSEAVTSNKITDLKAFPGILKKIDVH
jgi:hypothetical protein